MRFSTLFLALTLVCLQLLPAGSSSALEIQGFGIKGGYARVQSDLEYNGAQLLDSESCNGYRLGAFLKWSRHRRSSFRFLNEIHYAHRCYEASDGTNSQGGDADYLSLPFLFSPYGGDDFKLYFFAGPSLDILLSQDTDPILDELSPFSFSAHIGFGWSPQVDRRVSLLLEFRYIIDISNLYDPDPADPDLDSFRFREFQFLTGFGF